MKKIVAVFGALSTVFFVAHQLVASLYYLGLMPYSYIHMTIGGILSITMSIHMIFALTLMVKNRQRDKKAKQYPQLNMSMVLQSATGIFTGIFLLLHILVIELDKSQVLPGTLFNIIYIVVEFMFVLIVGMHIGISVPKHFISMGAVKRRASYPKLVRGTYIFMGLLVGIYVASQIVFWTA